ncbi:MAG: Gfo/Idh/MocA family oxidoreductase [Sedimentisphaerales bacterium]|nr:Gfo/Idh/MocA family oxidoreductase [Sedimentisphaerales bacterium]
MNRREFLGRSVVGAAGLSLACGGVLGANERVRIALIGCGGRGRIVARGLIENGAEIACLCDLHEGRLRSTADEIDQAQGRKPKTTKRMGEVLDSNDVDAVVIGLPDHWHGPASILACQAGKDVYVEKPHAHNIWEGRKMVEAARKYKRILQVGTQNRSAPYNKAAVEYIKSGKLGKIPLVKVYNLKPGGAFHLGDVGTEPDGFDWDTWLGAAPARPYHQAIFGGGWHNYWDFSGGDMANDGIHQLDLAMMLMGDPGMPRAVSCSGGRVAYKGDDSEVPDLQIVAFDFDDFVMTFELSGYPKYMRKTTGTIRRNDEFPYWTQNATRIELYGSDLMMTIGRHGGGWQVTTSGGKVVEQMYGRVPDYDHQKDFLDCIKTRKRPNADVGILHESCALVHLGNIAHRVGNEKLRFNPEKERFIDSDEANKLVKRSYRSKYEIPEQV